jgi:hypothetical protein
MSPDPETLIHAAILLAERAAQGEDVSAAVERLGELASQEEDAADDEE